MDLENISYEIAHPVSSLAEDFSDISGLGCSGLDSVLGGGKNPACP
jgi:hypothetical protein